MKEGDVNMYLNKKILLALIAAVVAGVSVAADGAKISLSEARGKINSAIVDQAVMASTIKSLAPADQTAFLAAVNAAIAKSPGSKESRSVMFLKANTAALKASKAGSGNMKAMLAEVFATASVDALCVINEYFASKLFNKSADPTKTYSDEDFLKIALMASKVVAERCEKGDDASVRTAFCLLMFARASGDPSEEMIQKLVTILPEEDRKVATEEWLPYALGLDGRKKSYEPMLGAADSDMEPDVEVVLRLTALHHHDSFLAMLSDTAAIGAEIFNEKIIAPMVPAEGDDMSEPQPYQGQAF